MTLSIISAALMLALTAAAPAPSPNGPIPATGAPNQTPETGPGKALVVYYSRTGNTRAVCQQLSALLGADLEEVTDTKSRKGIFGWLGGGRDAMRKKGTVIRATVKDPANYSLVVLATPVWFNTMTPAITSYILKHKERFKDVAFLCTMGGSGDLATFADMEALCGKKPLAALSLKTAEVRKGSFSEKLKAFADKLK